MPVLSPRNVYATFCNRSRLYAISTLMLSRSRCCCSWCQHAGRIAGRHHRACGNISSRQHKGEPEAHCKSPIDYRTCLHVQLIRLMQTRMQVFSTQPAAIYTGMTQAFTRISSTEGAGRLWRGVWSVILGAGPAHAVYFGTYEAIKDLAGGNREGHQFVATGARAARICFSSLG